MVVPSIATRLSRLEEAAHSGFKLYSVKCSEDVNKITTRDGIAFVDDAGVGLVEQLEQQLAALSARNYVLIINDIPKGVN